MNNIVFLLIKIGKYYWIVVVNEWVKGKEKFEKMGGGVMCDWLNVWVIDLLLVF